MAWQLNDGSGRWTNGTRIFNSSAEAQAAGGGTGGGFEYSALNGMFKIFLALGNIIGLVLGFLVGIFLKLGIVGKVVLTALSAFGAFVLVSFPLLMTVGNPASNLSDDAQGRVNLIMLIIALIPAVIVGLWMWLKHFNELKYMPLSSFAGLTAICFSICFYGTILIWIIASIMRKNGFYGFAGGMLITLVVSCAVWFLIQGRMQELHQVIIVNKAAVIK